MRTAAPAISAILVAIAPAVADAQAPPVCLDPATPPVELARTFEWQPSDRAARRAWPRLQTYLRHPSPRTNRDAALAYRGVLSQDPHDDHGRAAVALLHAAGPDLNYPESEGYRFTRMAGSSNAASAGARMLAEAVAEDSTLWLHAVALTRMALVAPQTSLVQGAMDAVERALTAGPRNTTLRLAQRDLLVLKQEYAAAREVVDAIDVACVPVMHARAEAMVLTGDNVAGAELYLQALQRAAPHELARFEDDVQIIISLAQRDAYRALPASQRRVWLQAFWTHSAAASGRTVHVRIAEHLQRAAWANANDKSPPMPPSTDQPISWQTDTVHHAPWGARGILYMRHGAPHRLYRAAYDRSEFEGWIYLIDEKPWTYVFVRGQTPEAPRGAAEASQQPVEAHLAPDPTGAPRGGWRMMSVASCFYTGSFLGRFQPERMRERLESGEPLDIRELYVAMSAYDPRHGDMAQLCTVIAAGGSHPELDDLRREWLLENERVYPERSWRSSAVPAFTDQVRVVTSAYEFRGAGGVRELEAIYWVPTADLHIGTDSASRSLRLTISLTDSIVAATRTDMTVDLPRTATGTMLTGAVTWRGDDVRTGTLRVVAIDPADTTRGGSGIHRHVVRTHTGALSMSDLVLAVPGARGALRRGAESVSPLPNHTIEHGSSARVFFELYGVEEDARLQTRVRIAPEGPKSIRESLGLRGSSQRELSFTTEAVLDARGVAIQDFDVGGDLAPGRYVMEISVRVGRTTLERSTILTVLE